MEDYTVLALNAQTYVEDVPSSFDEIERSHRKEDWKEAVERELRSLMQNGTWTLVNKPRDCKVIDCKWIFKIKRDASGNIDKFKPRLVAKGCAQEKGYDYDETYAPVARVMTLRILLSLIPNEGLLTCQLDVENAFLHGDLHETAYMRVPKGVEANADQVCKLNKTLYGLRQAPREWNALFDEVVKKLNFVRSDADKFLYVGINEYDGMFLLLYVDDMILAGKDRCKIESVKEKLKGRFRMKDMGEISTFLGIDMKKNEKGLFLNQSYYMELLLKRFNMKECNAVKTPIETKLDSYEKDDNALLNEPYRKLIGCLLYLSQTTRSDLSFAVNYFSKFQSDPKLSHWKGLKRILRYVKGTVDIGLFYCKKTKRF